MSALMRAWRRPLIAAAALVYLVVMYVTGAPPTHENRIESATDGILTLDPERIVAVELERDGIIGRFQRDHQHWQNAATGRLLDAAYATLLARAITFMHTAAPVRVLRPETIAGVATAAYGLDRPAIKVRLSTVEGPILTALFGNRTNDGILQYLRIEGRSETYLMSGFVGEAWSQLADPEAPINARFNHGEH